MDEHTEQQNALLAAIGLGPRYTERRIPTCYVALAGPNPALRTGDREAFGPFDSEDGAVLWLSENLPTRVLFTIFPVYDES